ncbi:hypothetical protein [Nonomuraea gerenzanensis]|uniref:hypothetical protein n=1 Tax=Nonomuraea gerenzanensis TaxID=93944 RepID=UPI001CD9916A|nr:hypothetical protein [Nonomuraea gerenzanensis]UBU13684.1 hypothetical protein LCN96_01195 [Nonomuraea gerenzanensis]
MPPRPGTWTAPTLDGSPTGRAPQLAGGFRELRPPKRAGGVLRAAAPGRAGGTAGRLDGRPDRWTARRWTGGRLDGQAAGRAAGRPGRASQSRM